MTQSVIVYTNPISAAFWESPYLIPAVSGILVSILVAVLVATLLEKLHRYTRIFTKYEGSIVLVSCMVSLIYTIWAMAI